MIKLKRTKMVPIFGTTLYTRGKLRRDFNVKTMEKLSSIELEADRPRYHAHTCWTPLLPLASDAARRTPRRASAQLMT